MNGVKINNTHFREFMQMLQGMARPDKLFQKTILLLVVFISFQMEIFAQNNTWDSWSGIKLSKQLNNKFRISLNPEIRLSDNFGQYELLVETGLEYAPIKFLALTAKYRFSSNYYPDKNKVFQHQMAFDVKGKWDYQRVKFQLRSRLSNYANFETDTYISNPYLRYRAKVAYNLKDCKFTPFASAELFHQLNDMEINKVRYTLGGSYKLTKQHFLSLEYHYQDYLKKEKTKNIIAIQYTFKF